MSDRLNTLEEEISPFNPSKIYWEGPFCYIDEKKFFPKIALNEFNDSKYNTLCLELNGKSKSDLNWNETIKIADDAIKNGKYIFWYLNLGLFSELDFSIFNQSQFLTLSLAIDHFNKIIWEKYKDFTIGICIYRGSLNFTTAFMNDPQHEQNFQSWIKEHAISDIHLKNLKEFYSSDVAIEYLDLLSHQFPETLECFIMLDATSLPDPILQAYLLSSERSDRLKFITKNCLLPPENITWDNENSIFGFIGNGNEFINIEKASLAICLPSMENYENLISNFLEKVIFYLIDKKYCFRIVSEANLTAEWDGLDTLIVDLSSISSLGLRKLQGFYAAGGEIISNIFIPSLPTRDFNDWKEEEHENFLWNGNS